MKSHDLKIWPPQFDAIIRGLKSFEIRKNDRDYRVGDILILKEFDPEKSSDNFTGRVILRRVIYMIQGNFGLEPEVCVMGLEEVVYLNQNRRNRNA